MPGPVPFTHICPMGEDADGAAEEVAVLVVDADVEELEFEELEDVVDLDSLRPTPIPTANAMIATSNNSISSQNVLFLNPHMRFSLILFGGGESSAGKVLLRPVLYSFIRWKAGGGDSGPGGTWKPGSRTFKLPP